MMMTQGGRRTVLHGAASPADAPDWLRAAVADLLAARGTPLWCADSPPEDPLIALSRACQWFTLSNTVEWIRT
jgi:hypothetical protein